jgi:two-component system OmpR family response regulator
MSSVLIITRDSSTQVLAEGALTSAGHEVVTADSSSAAIRSLFNVQVDSVVVDSSIGEDDVREFCDWLRSANGACPIVFLAPAGARWLVGQLPVDAQRDEIVVKPCQGKDVRQAVERSLQAAGGVAPATISAGDLSLDTSSHELRGPGETVQLTPTEFRLMSYLTERRGNIVPSEELLEKVWEFFPGTGSSELVRSHVRNLRGKLRLASGGMDMVQTVPRRGYRLL